MREVQEDEQQHVSTWTCMCGLRDGLTKTPAAAVSAPKYLGRSTECPLCFRSSVLAAAMVSIIDCACLL